jgi:hypothetical protein
VLAGALAAAALPAFAQAPTPPLFSTTKVQGTDGVYIFRYQGHQAMFIVTPEGVIATDPIGERRPAAAAYIAEIRKITQAPIRYVIYSHQDPDHVAGGKPFKDAGATFVAHRFARNNIARMNRADIVPVDEIVDDKRTISLGGTDLELTYLGRTMARVRSHAAAEGEDHLRRLPALSGRSSASRGHYLPDQEDTMKRSWRWTGTADLRHPGAGGRQIGTKDDVKVDLDYMLDLSAAVKKATEEGKCYAGAIAEIKSPKYEKLAGY